MYAAKQGCVGLRDALKCTSEAIFTGLQTVQLTRGKRVRGLLVNIILAFTHSSRCSSIESYGSVAVWALNYSSIVQSIYLSLSLSLPLVL